MELTMNIKVLLNENTEKALNQLNDTEATLKFCIEDKDFLGLGTITKVENIDYIMHEVKE